MLKVLGRKMDATLYTVHNSANILLLNYSQPIFTWVANGLCSPFVVAEGLLKLFPGVQVYFSRAPFKISEFILGRHCYANNVVLIT